MQSVLRRKWIDALRSDKYTQVREILKTHRGHCCLGVLCEISNHPDISVSADQITCNYPFYAHSSRTEITENILIDFGLTRDVMNDLIRLNDDERLTFSKIADWIEVNIPDDDIIVEEIQERTKR